MDVVEMRKILRLGKSFGLKKIRFGEFEAEFNDSPTTTQSSGIPIESEDRMPSDDEMLLYSSPAYDLVRAERKAALERESDATQSAI